MPCHGCGSVHAWNVLSFKTCGTYVCYSTMYCASLALGSACIDNMGHSLSAAYHMALTATFSLSGLIRSLSFWEGGRGRREGALCCWIHGSTGHSLMANRGRYLPPPTGVHHIHAGHTTSHSPTTTACPALPFDGGLSGPDYGRAQVLHADTTWKNPAPYHPTRGPQLRSLTTGTTLPDGGADIVTWACHTGRIPHGQLSGRRDLPLGAGPRDIAGGVDDGAGGARPFALHRHCHLGILPLPTLPPMGRAAHGGGGCGHCMGQAAVAAWTGHDRCIPAHGCSGRSWAGRAEDVAWERT